MEPIALRRKRERWRKWYRRNVSDLPDDYWEAVDRLERHKEPHRIYRGPLVAHCGEWHVVHEVPLRVTCCGAVLFGEEI